MESSFLIQGLQKLIKNFPPLALEELASKMERYISELVLFNSAYNLTNTSDHDELVRRHILDSLAGFEKICELVGQTEEPCVIGDIGSGGGLPGIPLAAAFACAQSLEAFKLPPVKVLLVERMEKRCSFLENCCALLGLKNAQVLKSEAEKAPAQAFNICVFRAFRPLDEQMTKTLLRLTKKDGYLCAYKAKLSSIKEEMTGIKNLIGEYNIFPLEVPGLEDSERNLVLVHNNY